MAVRDDARGHAIMAALPTSAHTAALEAWICALLMALFGRIEAFRQFFPHEIHDLIAEDERETYALIRRAIRATNRVRAWVGWRLRCHPNRGTRQTFGTLTPQLRPRSSRAPPFARANTQNPFRKPPSPAAMTHARSVSSSAVD
jgi:hypothetical protein